MPEQYYSDWLKVASEESYHFSLLEERLNELGYAYGDMPAHNGLWEMVLKTLKIILRDEIGHVAIGSHWFKYCCDLKNVEPEETFRHLLIEYMGGGPNGPLHEAARLQAGFSQNEIDELVKMV